MIDFDPTQGDEIAKRRPAVVVSSAAVGVLDLRIIVPITGWQQHYARQPWLVRIKNTQRNGLSKDSAADAFQVKSVAVSRFVRRLGMLTAEQLETITAAIALCIDYIP
ncbi:MAG TPA: type II toxin-antitoxin system PemK/MazF family toxin [Chloroflexota bacterium]